MPLAGRSKRLDECKRVGVMRMQLPTSCHHRDLVQILEHPAINWKTQVKILPSRLPFGAKLKSKSSAGTGIRGRGFSQYGWDCKC